MALCGSLGLFALIVCTAVLPFSQTPVLSQANGRCTRGQPGRTGGRDFAQPRVSTEKPATSGGTRFRARRRRRRTKIRSNPRNAYSVCEASVICHARLIAIGHRAVPFLCQLRMLELGSARDGTSRTRRRSTSDFSLGKVRTVCPAAAMFRSGGQPYTAVAESHSARHGESIAKWRDDISNEQPDDCTRAERHCKRHRQPTRQITSVEYAWNFGSGGAVSSTIQTRARSCSPTRALHGDVFLP